VGLENECEQSLDWQRLKALSKMDIAEMQGFLQEELDYWNNIRNSEVSNHYSGLF